MGELFDDEVRGRTLSRIYGWLSEEDAKALTEDVLETIAPLIAAKALRDFADEVVRELVCCDAYDGKGNKTGHSHCICYWGGAVAEGARINADRLENAK